MRVQGFRYALPVALAVAGLVGCGGQPKQATKEVAPGVRQIVPTGSTPGAQARVGSGSASGSGSGSGTGSGGNEPCKPVGDANTARTRVPVALSEWSVRPSAVYAPAGPIAFTAQNAGKEAHELVVIRYDDASQLPVDQNGKVDESKLGDKVIGEIEAFGPNQTCVGVFNLTPGRYALICNITEGAGDKVESHYKLGMRAAFTVNR